MVPRGHVNFTIPMTTDIQVASIYLSFKLVLKVHLPHTYLRKSRISDEELLRQRAFGWTVLVLSRIGRIHEALWSTSQPEWERFFLSTLSSLPLWTHMGVDEWAHQGQIHSMNWEHDLYIQSLPGELPEHRQALLRAMCVLVRTCGSGQEWMASHDTFRLNVLLKSGTKEQWA